MSNLYEWLVEHTDQASALSAIAGTAIAFFALVIALISLVVSITTVRIQKKHNLLSFRPVPLIRWEILDGVASVQIVNNGAGALFIKNITIVKDEVEHEDFEYLFRSIKDLGLQNFFGLNLSGKVVAAGEKRNLLSCRMKREGENLGTEQRIAIASTLMNVTIFCEYTDLYGSTFDVYSEELTSMERLMPRREAEVEQ